MTGLICIMNASPPMVQTVAALPPVPSTVSPPDIAAHDPFGGNLAVYLGLATILLAVAFWFGRHMGRMEGFKEGLRRPFVVAFATMVAAGVDGGKLRTKPALLFGSGLRGMARDSSGPSVRAHLL